MKFAVLIPVGPGARELERLRDLLNSLYCFESGNNAALVIVNDGNSDSELAALAEAAGSIHTEILSNPRDVKVKGWTDGLCAAAITGFRRVATTMRTAEFVLKLDTDSLVIAPFSGQIAEFFAAHPEIGMVGTYRREPDGGKPTTSIMHWGNRVQRLTKLLSFSRCSGLHVHVGLLGRARELRRFVSAATRNGYVFGESCIGGGYAVSRLALDKMLENGFLRDPLISIHRDLGEDILSGMLLRATGYHLADFNAAGEPFGVVWSGLCDSPHELLRKGHSIIHSVKDDPRFAEEDVRLFFAAQRAKVREPEGESVAT